jgi:arylsulfatase A-like enzyme
VGRLLEGLAEAEELEHSVVALTSDHGEGLEPGGERWSHGNSLYPELVRTPLAIRLPGATTAGSDCPGVATHLDLGATLLGLAGLSPQLGEGRPMLGRDGRCAAPRAAVFQSMASEGPTRDAVASEELALVWSRPDRFEAFDPAADPQQRHPLVSAPPEWIARLRGHVERENDRAARAGAAAPVEIGAEARSQLRELGYLE